MSPWVQWYFRWKENAQSLHKEMEKGMVMIFWEAKEWECYSP